MMLMVLMMKSSFYLPCNNSNSHSDKINLFIIMFLYNDAHMRYRIAETATGIIIKIENWKAKEEKWKISNFRYSFVLSFTPSFVSLFRSFYSSFLHCTNLQNNNLHLFWKKRGCFLFHSSIQSIYFYYFFHRV